MPREAKPRAISKDALLKRKVTEWIEAEKRVDVLYRESQAAEKAHDDEKEKRDDLETELVQMSDITDAHPEERVILETDDGLVVVVIATSSVVLGKARRL